MSEPESPEVIRRHTLSTRLWHWVTAVSVIILLGSGLMILNAHGQLYWGEYGANYDQPWFKLIWFFDTARVPGWLTIPSSYNLALARRWHLFFALVLAFALLAYMIVSLINRHFQRDLRIRAQRAVARASDRRLQVASGAALPRSRKSARVQYLPEAQLRRA
jgi:thiosulfate reductase cytochrome b subunit